MAKKPLKLLEKFHAKMAKNFVKLGNLIKKRGGRPAAPPK